MPHFKAALDIAAVNDSSIWECFHSIPNPIEGVKESGENGHSTDARKFPS